MKRQATLQVSDNCLVLLSGEDKALTVQVMAKDNNGVGFSASNVIDNQDELKQIMQAVNSARV